jgi:hypothetical protein
MGFKDNALNPQQVLKYKPAGVSTGIFASGIGGNPSSSPAIFRMSNFPVAAQPDPKIRCQ